MNRKFKNIAMIALSWIILILHSCYKDKGNYDISEINKVSILKVGSDTISINQFDSLRVNTQIEQTLHQGTENLSYKWTVFYNKAPAFGLVDQQLAETKDLDVQFGLEPADYNVLYTVTDKNTGVSVFKTYFLQVSSILSEGWLMVGENAQGQSDMHLLHPDGHVVSNILSSANPGLTIPKLHTSRVLTTMFNGAQHIYVLGSDNGFSVNYNTFVKLNEAANWFVETPAVNRPMEVRYDYTGINQFYVDNGVFYSNQESFRYGTPVAGNYYISRYFFQATSGEQAIIYDELNKRFYNSFNKRYNNFAPSANNAFDMNNVGMDVLFGGHGPDNRYHYLMKDAQQIPYVLVVDAASSVAKYRVDQGAKVLQSTQAVFSGLYMHMYYTVGNELYMLDIPNNASRLLYTFPADQQATALTIKSSGSMWVGFGDNNRTLVVGTYDGTKGSAYVFAIDNLGGITDNTYSYIYENIDKPIAFEWKNRR